MENPFQVSLFPFQTSTSLRENVIAAFLKKLSIYKGRIHRVHVGIKMSISQGQIQPIAVLVVVLLHKQGVSCSSFVAIRPGSSPNY